MLYLCVFKCYFRTEESRIQKGLVSGVSENDYSFAIVASSCLSVPCCFATRSYLLLCSLYISVAADPKLLSLSDCVSELGESHDSLPTSESGGCFITAMYIKKMHLLI